MKIMPASILSNHKRLLIALYMKLSVWRREYKFQNKAEALSMIGTNRNLISLNHKQRKRGRNHLAVRSVGRKIINFVHSPSDEYTSMRPLCRSVIMKYEIANPSPVPSPTFFVV